MHCVNCGTVPVPDEDLPVKLPLLSSPSILKKASPLGEEPTFLNTKCPSCGSIEAKRETDTLDTFVDSSWYFLRYLDHENPSEVSRREKVDEWMPVDMYVGGSEHAIMHLLYARFVHKFLCDVRGETDSAMREPFTELITQGLVRGKTYRERESGKYVSEEEVQKRIGMGEKEDTFKIEFEKMSKSKGNGVSPQELVDSFSVDVMRVYLMFAAPPESDIDFSWKLLTTAHAWVTRLFALADKVCKEGVFDEEDSIGLGQ